jgi:NADH dehydrogenase FAD-containing subunit
LDELTSPYDNLNKRHGIKIIQDSVANIDPDKKTVKLATRQNTAIR